MAHALWAQGDLDTSQVLDKAMDKDRAQDLALGTFLKVT